MKLMDDVDTARMKCSKLQGVIDGIFKDRILRLRDVVEYFTDKVDSQGDTKLLLKEKMEATAENKRLRKEIKKFTDKRPKR